MLSSLSQNRGDDDPHEFPTQQARRRDALSGDFLSLPRDLPLFQPAIVSAAARSPRSTQHRLPRNRSDRCARSETVGLWSQLLRAAASRQMPRKIREVRPLASSRSLLHPSCFLGLCRRGNCACLSLKHALSPLCGLCARSRRAWAGYIITSTLFEAKMKSRPDRPPPATRPTLPRDNLETMRRG